MRMPRAVRCAAPRQRVRLRRTLTILLFYVCTDRWTRLKVSHEVEGGGTWFKTGTISREIALCRLTSAVYIRELSIGLAILSFFPLTFSKMPSRRMWVVAPCALSFDFHCDVRTTALLSATSRKCITLNKVTDICIALHVLSNISN